MCDGCCCERCKRGKLLMDGGLCCDKDEHVDRGCTMESCQDFEGDDPSAGCAGTSPCTGEALEAHGRWEICSDGYYPYCSVCREEPKGGEMTAFCPSCGAKMDLGRKT